MSRTTFTPSPVEAGYRKPGLFLLLATLTSWACWIPAAFVSTEPWGGPVVAVLGMAGLIAPLGVVVWMTRRQPDLRRDIVRRLTSFRGVRPIWIVLACVIAPGAVVLATLISLPLGYPVDQLLLRGAITFTAGALPGWVVLIVAPVLEEAAWHAYGIDALRNRWSLFTGSVLFGVVWAVWHVPLSFISGTSQAQTADTGLLHALNFPISAIPFVILMNWVYVRSGRNILVTVLFHLAGNLVTQVLSTHPDTEVMATGIMVLASVLVVWFERDLFFAKPVRIAAAAPELVSTR